MSWAMAIGCEMAHTQEEIVVTNGRYNARSVLIPPSMSQGVRAACLLRGADRPKYD
jgi:hypothetical protein